MLTKRGVDVLSNMKFECLSQREQWWSANYVASTLNNRRFTEKVQFFLVHLEHFSVEVRELSSEFGIWQVKIDGGRL